MVERSRRAKGKRKLLGNHQRCWLWGRNLVRETLLAARWPILELHLASDLPADQLAEAQQEATAQGVAIEVSGREALQRLARTAEHQGYLAKMAPYPFLGVEELLASASARPLFLVLDSIQDPFNFGAMLRSAAAFAVDGVFIGSRAQVPVTSLVARSSAGAINRVRIAQVDDLPALAQVLKAWQIQIVGASEKSTRELTACDFSGGLALILGNEGTGISPQLLAGCDTLARIPLSAGVDSLNAAAAAAVFLFEVQRQRAPSAGGQESPAMR
jgi:23S rRNA (guanosine2251-2'-O)-methyltransferase